jgi:myo-inositol-1(or 4)-monophosphatase
VTRTYKADGSIVTEADPAVQQRIASALLQQWPDTVVLGEEMTAEEQASLLASDKPVWCLDPLDGTSNFAAGIPFFSVSLSLLRGGEVILGVVYDPLRDEFFAGNREEGASLNGKPLVIDESGLRLSQTTAIIDFKRLSNDLSVRLITESPYSSQRNFGSVALDWCWLAMGRSHIYLHGRSSIWDYAAGNLIFHLAGGYSASLSGDPVFVNSLQPRAAIAAVDQSLFEEWIEWLGIERSEWVEQQLAG